MSGSDDDGGWFKRRRGRSRDECLEVFTMGWLDEVHWFLVIGREKFRDLFLFSFGIVEMILPKDSGMRSWSSEDLWTR